MFSYIGGEECLVIYVDFIVRIFFSSLYFSHFILRPSSVKIVVRFRYLISPVVNTLRPFWNFLNFPEKLDWLQYLQFLMWLLVLCMTLNWIRWWDSSSEALRNVERSLISHYSHVHFDPEWQSMLRSQNKSNRSVWKLFVIDRTTCYHITVSKQLLILKWNSCFNLL